MANAVVLRSLYIILFVAAVKAQVGAPCAAERPHHGVYAPHPTNCSQYLQCVHGYFAVRSCPVGLHWSAALNICHLPHVAHCEDNHVTDDDVITPSNPGTDDDFITSTNPGTDDDVITPSHPGTDDDIITNPYPGTDDDVITPSNPGTDDDVITPSHPGTDDDIITHPRSIARNIKLI